MTNRFKASMVFEHGNIEVSGTSIFVMATLAQIQQREGWLMTNSDPALNKPLVLKDIALRQAAIDNINIGDVVAEMHMHDTNSGILKGWEVVNRYETTEEMAAAIALGMPINREASNKIIGNKYARVFGVIRDADYAISAVQVVYIYDTTYHCATLQRPASN